MSDSLKHRKFNDSFNKVKQPNHLASLAEKQAAAGATIPKQLSHKYNQLQHLSQLAKYALQDTLPSEIIESCCVVKASATEITLSFNSPTAVNHMRYMMENCVQALRAYDLRFSQLQKIKVILTPKLSKLTSHSKEVKKTLSENTKTMITQTAEFVTNNTKLQTALLHLAEQQKKLE